MLPHLRCAKAVHVGSLQATAELHSALACFCSVGTFARAVTLLSQTAGERLLVQRCLSPAFAQNILRGGHHFFTRCAQGGR